MALIEVLRKYKFVQAPDTEVYVYIASFPGFLLKTSGARIKRGNEANVHTLVYMSKSNIEHWFVLRLYTTNLRTFEGRSEY